MSSDSSCQTKIEYTKTTCPSCGFFSLMLFPNGHYKCDNYRVCDRISVDFPYDSSHTTKNGEVEK